MVISWGIELQDQRSECLQYTRYHYHLEPHSVGPSMQLVYSGCSAGVPDFARIQNCGVCGRAVSTSTFQAASCHPIIRALGQALLREAPVEVCRLFSPV